MSYIIYNLKTKEYIDSTEDKWIALEYLDIENENNESIYGCVEVDLGEVLSAYWEQIKE